MDVKSQQLVMDLWLDKDVEPVIKKICSLVESTFTVVSKGGHKFEPQGETIVFVLSESHFSLHSYPEHNYLTLDIYICNMTIDLSKVQKDIENICNPIKVDAKIIKRGHGQGIS